MTTMHNCRSEALAYDFAEVVRRWNDPDALPLDTYELRARRSLVSSALALVALAAETGELQARRDPNEGHGPLGRPTPEEFAVEWLRAAERLPTGRRGALATLYRVSPPTIDRWLRVSRDKGLIPPPTVGRPRREAAG